MQNSPIFDLIRLARLVRMSHKKQEEQRINFVYENTSMGDPAIIRELVTEVANKPKYTATYYYQGE